MHHGIDALVAALTIAGLGLLFAVGPSADLAFLLQFGAAGAFVGTLVVYRARSRGIDVDAWLVTTRWSVAGVLLGAVVLALTALRS